MKFDPNLHHRRSIRLQGYDYTRPGAYFITMVTYQRQEIFGFIEDNQMHLSQLGEIARQEWFRSTKIRKEIRLFEDEFVVMPNHIHGIVWIVDTTTPRPVGVDGVDPIGVNPIGVIPDGIEISDHNPPDLGERHSPLHDTLRPQQPAKSLPSFVGGYKSVITGYAKRELDMPSIWQRNYFDHIIRNEKELNYIWNYIDTNPDNWSEDQLHPSAPPNKFNRMQK